MVLSRQRAEELFKKVLKYSTADETEAMMGSTFYSLTRFANNFIHQNVSEDGAYLSVRAVAGQRTARASTNKFDEATIRQVCEAALSLAKLQPPDPDLLPLPGPQTFRSIERHYEETAALTPQARAETVKAAIARAEKDHLTAAGIFSSGVTAQAIFNSRGLKSFHEETLSEFSVTMLDESSSGWAKRTSPNWNELEPEVLADRAATKALASREPREVPAGKYTVIREPDAVLDLLGFLFWDFGGLSVHGAVRVDRSPARRSQQDRCSVFAGQVGVDFACGSPHDSQRPGEVSQIVNVVDENPGDHQPLNLPQKRLRHQQRCFPIRAG